MASANGGHLGADHLCDLGHQADIPSGGQAQPPREGGGPAVEESSDALLVDHRWDPQSGAFYQHLLDFVAQLRRFAGQQSGARADAGDLPDAVGQHLGGMVGIEVLVLDQSSEPNRS